MENTNKNPYYIDNDSFLNDNTGTKARNMKRNNVFILNALNSIKYSNPNDKNLGLNATQLAILLSGRLPKQVEGCKTKELGEKLKFLVLALGDKEHPENREIFNNSFLSNTLLSTLFSGGDLCDERNNWSNYKIIPDCKDEEIKNKNSLTAAFRIYRDDPNTPIGLNLVKIIDSLVTKDTSGNYKLEENLDIKEKAEMLEAINMQIDALKSNKRFTDNFKNPLLPANGNDKNLGDDE